MFLRELNGEYDFLMIYVFVDLPKREYHGGKVPIINRRLRKMVQSASKIITGNALCYHYKGSHRTNRIKDNMPLLSSSSSFFFFFFRIS